MLSSLDKIKDKGDIVEVGAREQALAVVLHIYDSFEYLVTSH